MLRLLHPPGVRVRNDEISSMILYLNTTNRSKTVIGIQKSDDDFNFITEDVSNENPQKLIQSIDDTLVKNNITGPELDGIIVATGPGGFSSTRLGVTVANELSYTWEIKVAGVLKPEEKSDEIALKEGIMKLTEIKEWQPVAPEYGRAPNITKPKS